MSKIVRGDSERHNDEEDSPFSTPKLNATQINEEKVPDLKLPTRSGFISPADLPPLQFTPTSSTWASQTLSQMAHVLN